MSALEEVDDDSFDASVLQAGRPVLVDFWAPWCGPCRALVPMLERLAAEHRDHLTVLKYDIDRSRRAREEFGIRSIPTLVVFRDGREMARCTGGSPGQVKALLSAAYGRDAPTEPQPLFDGHPERKTLALLRLTETRSTSQLPSTRLSGGDSTLLSESLGLPDWMAAFLDGLHEVLPDFNDLPERFLREWITTLEVGQAPGPWMHLLRVLMHDDELGLLPNLAKLAQVGSLARAVQTAQSQAAGADWDALHQQWQQRSDQDPDDPYLAVLQQFMRPLEEIQPAQAAEIYGATLDVRLADLRQRWWNADESARLAETEARVRAQLQPITESLPQPLSLDQIRTLLVQHQQLFAAEQPALHARQSELNHRQGELFSHHGEATARQLLLALRPAP